MKNLLQCRNPGHLFSPHVAVWTQNTDGNILWALDPYCPWFHTLAWIHTSHCLETWISAGDLHGDGTEHAEHTSRKTRVQHSNLLTPWTDRESKLPQAYTFKREMTDGIVKMPERPGIPGECVMGTPEEMGLPRFHSLHWAIHSFWGVETLKTNTACLTPFKYYSPLCRF